MIYIGRDLKQGPPLITRAVLRLECSLDCISGSPTKYFHFLTVSVSFEIKKM